MTTLKGGKTMSHWKRTVAFMLTLLLAVSGLPAVPTAQAAIRTVAEEALLEGVALSDGEMPSTAMRFVQTGFDEETGILTMSLQIKPYKDNGHEGKEVIREGVFAFQTDFNSVTPVTNVPLPDEQDPTKEEKDWTRRRIFPSAKRIAVVVDNNSSLPDAMKNFLADNTQSQIISGEFSRAMNTGANQFYSKWTGYMVSSARSEQTGMLDCYFQFYFYESGYPEHPQMTEDGYYNVIDLDFECYAGDTDVLTAENVLAAGSIRVPQNAAEAKEIVDQFQYTAEGGNKIPLAMGAAGFIQGYPDEDDIPVESHSYYYFDQPTISQWRATAKRVTWNNGTPLDKIAGETAPGLWYENCTMKYRVRELVLDIENTFALKTDNPDADFYYPVDTLGGKAESTDQARYSVPTFDGYQRNDAQWEAPEIYQGEGKRTALKYYISTNVSNSSVSSPQNDEEDGGLGFENFVDGLKWEFAVQTEEYGWISMESLSIQEESGEGKTVDTTDGKTYRVRVATLDDSRLAGTDLQGKKIWVVYEDSVLMDGQPSPNDYLMRMPVGVTLDMVPSQVFYTDWFDEDQPNQSKDKVPVPQFHLSYEAADADNYIWHVFTTEGGGDVPGGKKGIAALRAIYDPTGRDLISKPLQVLLYVDNSVPSEVKITGDGVMSEILDPEDPMALHTGNTALDGLGEETVNDGVTKGQAVVHTALYDQYGLPYQNVEMSLELIPKEADLYKDGKTNPFQVVKGTINQDEENPVAGSQDSYTIIYRDGMSVNDVAAGEHVYTLKATYSEPGGRNQRTDEKDITVTKPADRLTYVRTVLSNSNRAGASQSVTDKGIPGTIIEVEADVPARDTNLQSVTKTEQVYIAELSNQWRDPSITPEDISVYDLVDGIRNEGGGTINIGKATAEGMPFTITFKATDPNGKVYSSDSKNAPQGVGFANIDNGGFTYDSTTAAGTEFVLRMDVTYKDEANDTEQSRFVEYHFRFTRSAQELKEVRITPPDGEENYTLEVPALTEGTKEFELDVKPYDQYGTVWNWPAVIAAYGGNWSLEPYNSTLPSGVALVGDNNGWSVSISPQAKGNESFSVRTKYINSSGNTVYSEPMVINVKRAPRVPTNVTIAYSGGTPAGAGTIEITPPNKEHKDDEGNLQNAIYVPTLTVLDQYGEPMDDYETVWAWDYTVSPADSETESVDVDLQSGNLTVYNCAQNCTARITVLATRDEAGTTGSLTVAIKRATDYPFYVEVKDDVVELPTKADVETGNAAISLTARGRSQYDEENTIKDFRPESIRAWVLESVTFGDGTTVQRAIKTADGEQLTNQIPHTNGRYNARNMIFLSDDGKLTFGNYTDISNIPTEITVSVICISDVETEEPHKIVIHREESVPAELYIPEDQPLYRNGVEIPTSDDPDVEVPLIAYVRDQYGLVMNNAEVTWSYEGEPINGVTMKLSEKTVVIGSTAPSNRLVELIVTHGELQEILRLRLWHGAQPEPQTVTVSGYTKDGDENSTPASGAAMTMSLPVRSADNDETSSDFYLLEAAIIDQYGTEMYYRPLTWWITDSSSGVSAEIIDEARGRLRLDYTETAVDDLDKGREVSFTAHVKDSLSGMEAQIKVLLKLDDPVVTYAVPEMAATLAQEGFTMENGVLKPVIPEKGEPEREVPLRATVRDQYGRVMSGEKAEIRLSDVLTPGVRLVPGANDNEATLWVASNSPLAVRIVAIPVGMDDSVRDDSELLLALTKGPSVPFALYLEKASDTYDIPKWNSDPAANVPSADTTAEYILKVEVHDQYDAWLESALNYPIGKFEGDHTGVEFAPGYENGSPKDLYLEVSNRAVPEGRTTQAVTLQLHTKGKTAADGADFEKTFRLNLRREAAKATYLYITGADADGVSEEPLQRPDTDEKTRVYQFSPVVYDQYGIPVEGAEIQMSLDRSALEAIEGITVEEVYAQGQSAGGDRPAGYKVYKDEDGVQVLLAEFNCLTGELTVYTKCDLSELTMVARYPALGENGEKKLTVRMAEEEKLRAKNVAINSAKEIVINNGETDPIEENAYPTVYDQYDDAYHGNVRVQWALLQKDEETGEYVAYDSEVDEADNGQPLVTMEVLENDLSNAITLIVNPGSFSTEKTVVLQCRVFDLDAEDSLASMMTQYSEIDIHRPKRHGGSSGEITVFFDAGEFGKLVGPSVVTVESGSVPEEVPGVKTEEGYGFVGWTSDGLLVVDASKIPVTGDTFYTAVYKNITNTKFLEGYGDNTIRPQQHITRAEFVSMLVRALGGYQARAYYGKSFRDVADDQWYAGAIAYAKQMGIVSGYEDGTFRPQNPITRAEAARILADAAALTSYVGSAFPDVNPNKWYAGYIDALAEAGVADGYEDGTFRPQNYITRAESVKLIVMITTNALNELERTNIHRYAYCPFTDIKRADWAYPYILRAAGIA